MRRDIGNSVAQHHINNPEALDLKASVKLVSTIVAASTAYQESRLGTTSGKGYYCPNVRVDGLGATCCPLGLLPGAASTNEMLDFLSEDKTMYCTKPLLERAEQDGETTRQAAHRSRVQAWSSSWPSAPCPADREEHHLLRLPFVVEISFRLCLLFFRTALF